MKVGAYDIGIESQALCQLSCLEVKAVLAVSDIEEHSSVPCGLGLGLDLSVIEKIVVLAVESVGYDISLLHGIKHILDGGRHMSYMYHDGKSQLLGELLSCPD